MPLTPSALALTSSMHLLVAARNACISKPRRGDGDGDGLTGGTGRNKDHPKAKHRLSVWSESDHAAEEKHMSVPPTSIHPVTHTSHHHQA